MVQRSLHDRCYVAQGQWGHFAIGTPELESEEYGIT